MNDVRKTIYATIIGFFLMLGLWFSIIYISSCGFTLTCYRADFKVERTPIPTLIPASHSGSQMDANMEMSDFEKCQVSALDLVGAWVSADAPETEPFVFTDVNDQSCEGTYAENIQPLLVENSAWQSGSLGCVSCHNAELSDRSAGLDLSSYDAIAGSGALDSNWESSSLKAYLEMGLTADGHSADMSAGNPLVWVGMQTAANEDATPTP
jgi:hypothetical protein